MSRWSWSTTRRRASGDHAEPAGQAQRVSHGLRSALFDALREADADPDVPVIVIRGAGRASPPATTWRRTVPRSRLRSASRRWWSRHVLNGWFEMWDMATPVIAQVHGYCLAGGTELATACDLVYVAEDARSAIRRCASCPARHGSGTRG